MKKSLFLTALSLTMVVGINAQSKLTGTALQQLTRVNQEAARQMAPNRDGKFRVLPQERITEGNARLVLRLESEDDVQAVSDQVKALGGKVLAVIGKLVQVQMPCAAVSELETNSAISVIDGTRQVKPMCNLARRDMGIDQLHNAIAQPELQLPQDYDGTGVIVGIIDSGFEYQHYNFRDSEGRSRIRAVWQVEADETAETGIKYVSYETPEEIAQLVTDPSSSPTDFHSHASHTTGISAGSAYVPEGAYTLNDSIGRMKGMAPNADLILCSVSLYPDDAAIAAAAQYILNYADSVGMPAAINLSMGGNVGPHDGSDNFTYALGEMFEDKPGHVMCVSAGNEGSDKMSFRKEFESDEEGIVLTLNTSGAYDIWCDDDSPITFSLCYNDSVEILDFVFEEPFETTVEESTMEGEFMEYKLQIGTGVDINGRTELMIMLQCDTTIQHELDKKMPRTPRYLSLMIEGRKGQSLTGYTNNKFIDLPDLMPEAYIRPTADYSINAMCCNPYVISVGAHVTRTAADAFHPLDEGPSWFVLDRGFQLNDIAPFSSYGPDFHGNYYPMISAPGSMICSSMCNYEPEMETYSYGYTSFASDGDEGYFWGWMQGTSMSCPAATGAVALMLQANPQLTAEQIMKYITDTATQDSYTADKSNRFGAGKLNALAAVQAIVDDLTPTQIEQVAAPRHTTGRRYNLQGLPVGPDYRGLFIER